MTWIHVTAHVCAVVPRHPTVVHALDGIAWIKHPKRNRTAVAACGRRVRPLGAPTSNGETRTLVWPPYVEGAESVGLRRCRECYAATGRPKPVAELGTAEFAATKREVRA